MKKIITILMAVSLLMIAGCSDDSNKAEDGKDSNESATESETNNNDESDESKKGVKIYDKDGNVIKSLSDS
ncbi:hypothetical protein [Virgibacillus siamensis]|uniref:hypothetical protein n=1 Tax=Virgibacillus siamensis TaxID=480071 RepID=UPI0009857DDC|nr:hypothetical protein [Virgibacillus siamensis]